jgi:hypothetical protein
MARITVAVNSTAYEASRVITANPARLHGICGYNSKTSAQFIQVHDSATLPADGDAPEILLTVPASSNFSFDSITGYRFNSGIVVCNSSTGATKTIGSADCWFSAEYS